MLVAVSLLAFLALVGVIAGTVVTSSANFLIAGLIFTVVFVTALVLALDAAQAAHETRNGRAGVRSHGRRL